MFAKDELIIYGNRGVCRVVDITVLQQGEVVNDKLYYVLAPLNSPASTMFVPVDNDRIVMRTLISPEEVEALIREMPSLSEIQVVSEKVREQAYKDCLRTGDCRQYVRMIKTLQLRKHARLAKGKKMTSTDEKYMKLVEEALYSELAQQLGMTKDMVPGYIRDRLAAMA